MPPGREAISSIRRRGEHDTSRREVTRSTLHHGRSESAPRRRSDRDGQQQHRRTIDGRTVGKGDEMSTSNHVRRNRVAARVAVVATVPCAAVAFLAGAALATDEDDRPFDHHPVVDVADGNLPVVLNPEAPIWVQARERVRQCRLAAQLPPNWPAAQVLRDAAEQPLGDPLQRAQWLRDATLMPSYWPAAQVLLADAEQRWDCSWVS
jgi:hypothetical protein